MVTPFWEQVNEQELAQGDLLERCLVPVFSPNFGPQENGRVEEVPVATADLIIVTQSCDLENKKVDFVSMCPIYTLAKFEERNPRFTQKGQWENVRKGRVEGLHLLACPGQPENNKGALVVDFGLIYSLPYDYLVKRTATLGNRWRLVPPFREHFSQAFARYFMRVGLPSAIPPFK
jgi:hypothetical protein